MRMFLVFFTLISGIATSCNNTSGISKTKDQIVKYIHISHTRTAANPNVVGALESTDLSNYDMLWLGGDLAHASSLDDETMNYLDNLFDLGNPNTLWALGNHDYSDKSRVQSFTKRPAFYATHKNGITFLVLDTQDSLSNIVKDQRKLFDKVTDTIQNSTHLVLLHHKLFWMYGNPELEAQIGSISNAKLGGCSYCINPNSFYTDIYPKLSAIEGKGIEVLCIAGDIGFKASEFQYETAEGIQFLASGMSFEADDNLALVFTHDFALKKLSWEFKSINSLE